MTNVDYDYNADMVSNSSLTANHRAEKANIRARS